MPLRRVPRRCALVVLPRSLLWPRLQAMCLRGETAPNLGGRGSQRIPSGAVDGEENGLGEKCRASEWESFESALGPSLSQERRGGVTWCASPQR